MSLKMFHMFFFFVSFGINFFIIFIVQPNPVHISYQMTTSFLVCWSSNKWSEFRILFYTSHVKSEISTTCQREDVPRIWKIYFREGRLRVPKSFLDFQIAFLQICKELSKSVPRSLQKPRNSSRDLLPVKQSGHSHCRVIWFFDPWGLPQEF